jgi:acetylglutamate kinase
MQESSISSNRLGLEYEIFAVRAAAMTDFQDATNLPPALKASVLSEALPYIRHFHGKTIVVKYGGNAMIEPRLQQSFAHDVVLLKLVGLNPVVVHGGGPQINAALQRLGKQGTFVQGMRVTDADTMQIVEWVLGGQVQQEIVMMINEAGGKAVGLTGKDGSLIRAHKKLMENPKNPKEPLDIGFVGDITCIEPAVVKALQDDQFIPVISPIGYGQDGTAYNINADLVAGKMATVLHAEKLLIMTNTPGVLDKNGNLLRRLSANTINQLLADGTLSGGMLPKISSSLEAARHGVHSVHIVDGRVPHCLLLELLTDQGVGTMITAHSG